MWERVSNLSSSAATPSLRTMSAHAGDGDAKAQCTMLVASRSAQSAGAYQQIQGLSAAMISKSKLKAESGGGASDDDSSDDEELDNALQALEEDVAANINQTNNLSLLSPNESATLASGFGSRGGGGGGERGVFSFGAAAAPAPASGGQPSLRFGAPNAQMSVIESETKLLLEQLKKEPTEEDDFAVKFSIYENLSQTVGTIREGLFEFWKENQSAFEGDTLRQTQRKLDNIDKDENMLGIPDDSTTWFVYFMAKTSYSNQTKLNKVLSEMRATLALLAQEVGDCPCCLEPIDSTNGNANVKVMSCAHKMCSDCWTHWKELKGERVFCPLCNHREFVDDIASNM